MEIINTDISQADTDILYIKTILNNRIVYSVIVSALSFQAHSGQRPSKWTIWRRITYPLWGLVAIGSEISVRQ